MTILRGQEQPGTGPATATPSPTDEPSPRRHDILPVILGDDIGAYSLARSFHEAYGVRSVVVSRALTGVVRRSQIVENVVEPQIDDIVCLVTRLREIARSTSATCLLLGATAGYVRRIVEHRRRLEDLFVVPYPRRDILDQGCDHERFSQLCTQLGVAHSNVLHDGTQARVLTCYSDRYGDVRLASFGQVLPGTSGSPVGVVTARADAVVAQAVRLLEYIGWTGFSTFDITVDPVDGTHHFVRLNPQLGPSSCYVTATGHNPARYYVTEHVDGHDVKVLAPADGPTSDEARPHVTVTTGAHLCTVLPHRLLLSRLEGPLRVQAAALIASGAATNPLRYRPERDLRRLVYLAAAQARLVRRYRRRPRRSAPQTQV